MTSGKLIIGFDGSVRGRDALELGRLLAEASGATALVASVQPPRGSAGLADVASERARERRIEARTERLLAEVPRRMPGIAVETRLLHDRSPARALRGLVERERPVALVIGSSHHGKLGRVLPGSTGTALLEGTPSAIAVAPAGYAERDRAERRLLSIAAAVDGSATSEPALEAAIGLVDRVDGALTILTVAGLPSLGAGAALAAIGGAHDPDLTRARMADVLDRAAHRPPYGMPVHRRLLRGDPASELAEAAGGYDLMVLGSRGHGALRGALLGSVSGKLARGAPCPLLILPCDAGADPLRLAEHGDVPMLAGATA